MDAEEFIARKTKMFQYFVDAGVNVPEAEKYFNNEIEISKRIGMNEEDGRSRSIRATMNYYRKQLEKMGTRAKFICLAVTSQTDYGLGMKVRAVKEQYKTATQSEKTQMGVMGLVDNRGNPLHTNNTTHFSDKIGQVINLDDEVSQTMFGVIEDDKKVRYPSLIRIYGKVNCSKPKPMFIWGHVSGEQTKSEKLPGYVCITTRDPLFSVQPTESRIDLATYESYINQYFANEIKDVSDVDLLQFADMKNPIIIKNGALLSIDKGTHGWETMLVKKSERDVDVPNVIAEVKIPNHIPIDFDESMDGTELYMFVLPRGINSKDNAKINLDAIGIYSNIQVDRNKYKAEESLVPEEKQPGSKNNADFFTFANNVG